MKKLRLIKAVIIDLMKYFVVLLAEEQRNSSKISTSSSESIADTSGLRLRREFLISKIMSS